MNQAQNSIVKQEQPPAPAQIGKIVRKLSKYDTSSQRPIVQSLHSTNAIKMELNESIINSSQGAIDVM